MSTNASKAFHQVLAPKATGQNAVQSSASSTSANSVPIFTGLGADAPTGKCYVTFEAVTEDCYIRILAEDDASPDVTSQTGMLVKADTPGVSFWLDTATEAYVEFKATGSGYLKWYVASPDYDE